VLSLEKKIEKFEERISKLHNEMLELKHQHTEMIETLKKKLGK
jgi:phosphopantetheine adenylyltransferase